MDDYKDFEDLGLDDDLTNNFTKAANCVQKLASTLDNNTLLLLYGYYKQGLEGTCNIPKPSWYDMKGKSKWEAWNKLGDMKEDEAKNLYIELVTKLDPDFEASTNSSKEGWVTVSTLQNHCEDPDTEKTLIDYVKEGDFEKVKDCLLNPDDDFKNNIDSLDEDGLGLIHWAADRGSVDVLNILVSHGAGINVCDAEGQTPLHYAVSCGHIDCVKFLLDLGSDPHIKDSDGMDCFAAVSDDSVKSMLCNYQKQ